MTLKKDLFLSTLFALLITFSFPPFQFGFLVYVAFIPLLLLLENKSKNEIFRWSYFAGFLTNVMLLYWVGWATVAGAIGAILILPLYVSLFAILHIFSQRKWGDKAIFLIPFWWTAIEWIKTIGQIGFPWFTVGYSQSYYLPLIQFASYCSVIGVSFWVLCVNVIFYLAWKKASHPKDYLKYGIIFTIFLLVPLIHGLLIVPENEPVNQKKLRIALVQGNIDPFQKWKPEFKDTSFVSYGKLTADIAKEKPELIIWPETATPCWLKHEFAYLKRVKKQIDSLNIPLLTGTPDYQFITDTEYRTYNAAILIQPQIDEIQTSYKSRLVPFGERIPYEDTFPFTLIKDLLNKLEMGQGNFSPGDSLYVFQFKKKSPGDSLLREEQAVIKFGVAICYESVFPQIVRNFILKGAQFQIVITNDAWFGITSMPFQHLQYAVFRAIENRISIARCANAGFSTFIDPFGRIKQRTQLYQTETLIQDISIAGQNSFYVRHGNIFANGNLILSILLLLITILRRKRTTSQTSSSS